MGKIFYCNIENYEFESEEIDELYECDELKDLITDIIYDVISDFETDISLGIFCWCDIESELYEKINEKLNKIFVGNIYARNINDKKDKGEIVEFDVNCFNGSDYEQSDIYVTHTVCDLIDEFLSNGKWQIDKENKTIWFGLENKKSDNCWSIKIDENFSLDDFKKFWFPKFKGFNYDAVLDKTCALYYWLAEGSNGIDEELFCKVFESCPIKIEEDDDLKMLQEKVNEVLEEK